MAKWLTETRMWPRLLIFDFDGVLADSEVLACSVAAHYATELGAPMTIQEALDEFVGRRAIYVQSWVENRIGYGVADFIGELHRRTLVAFNSELEPIAGAADFLRRTSDIQRCIASSSSHARLQASLARIGFVEEFRGTVFSADDVERGKPFPDLFLHAASKMGVSPDAALVVEDSVGGVQAGVAAGMRVAGLLAGSHIRPCQREILERAAANPVLDSYHELSTWLEGAEEYLVSK